MNTPSLTIIIPIQEIIFSIRGGCGRLTAGCLYWNTGTLFVENGVPVTLLLCLLVSNMCQCPVQTCAAVPLCQGFSGQSCLGYLRRSSFRTS